MPPFAKQLRPDWMTAKLVAGMKATQEAWKTVGVCSAA
jgi:hypothetical protein